MDLKKAFKILLLVKIGFVAVLIIYSSCYRAPEVTVLLDSSDVFATNSLIYNWTYLKNKPFPGIINYTDYVVHKFNYSKLNVDATIPSYTPIYNDAFFNYSIEVPRCIMDPYPNNKITVFIVVISAPSNEEKRQAIRETWLDKIREVNSIKTNTTAIVAGIAFVIGKSSNNSVNENVVKESIQNKDIIVVDMMDKYFDLSIKVGGLFRWLDKNCANVDFLLKLDDDVFVNVRNLGMLLKQIDPAQPSIYGVTGNRGVARGISYAHKKLGNTNRWFK